LDISEIVFQAAAPQRGHSANCNHINNINPASAGQSMCEWPGKEEHRLYSGTWNLLDNVIVEGHNPYNVSALRFTAV